MKTKKIQIGIVTFTAKEITLGVYAEFMDALEAWRNKEAGRKASRDAMVTVMTLASDAEEQAVRALTVEVAGKLLNAVLEVNAPPKEGAPAPTPEAGPTATT